MNRFAIVAIACMLTRLGGGVTVRAAQGTITPPGTTITYNLPASTVRFVSRSATFWNYTYTTTTRIRPGVSQFPVAPFDDSVSYKKVVVSGPGGSVTATYKPNANPDAFYFPDWEITYTGSYNPTHSLQWEITTALGSNMELFLANATSVSPTRAVASGFTWVLSDPVPDRYETATTTTTNDSPWTAWGDTAPAASTYFDGYGVNSGTKAEYRIATSPALIGKKVRWTEIFTPADGSAPQSTLKEWTITDTQSALYRLRPTSNGSTAVSDLELVDAVGELAVDANRDGIIKLASEGSTDLTSATNPYRFWVNDDDDSGDMGGDDVPGKTTGANYADSVVNGARDLVDFFPVFLDLKQLLALLPPSASMKYKLKQADSALNFVYTNLAREMSTSRDGALAYQKKVLTTGFGPNFTQAAGAATTQQITAAGIELSPTFLAGVRDSDWGVLLIEGRAPTTAPLVLSVEKDDTSIAEVKLELRISNVEDMFRHVDMTQLARKYDSSTYTLPAPVPATHTGDPGEAWPDSQTNGKYFVFLHGFNIDGPRARGWNSEVFKRLHVLGSKARFVGVTWHGATGAKLGGSYTDYHGAVFNAFQTGDALAGALSFTGSADVTVAAHSLGNIVASQAIQSGGLAPTRYYMINAASPIEAYDLPNVPESQITRMTESKWKLGAPGNRSTYAANWHQFFDATPSDHRSELKWKGRFSGILLKTHNFYSPGDDVVEDPEWDSPSVLALIFTQGFNFSRGAWVTQEFAKGANVGESLAVLNLSRVQGGWGESVFYTPPWGIGSLPPSPDQTREPYFGYFLEHDLFDVDPAKASAKAGLKFVQYDLLARGVPALSFAAAVHPLKPLENPDNPSLNRNFDMESLGRDSGSWPTEGHTADGKSTGRWLHSDFKNVALPYVHKMYEEMINRGSLK